MKRYPLNAIVIFSMLVELAEHLRYKVTYSNCFSGYEAILHKRPYNADESRTLVDIYLQENNFFPRPIYLDPTRSAIRTTRFEIKQFD